MKKLIWPMILVCLLSGCSAEKLNLNPEAISQITITVIPENEELTRIYTDDVKINAVCTYLNSLNLISRFTEKADEYEGQTYVLTITDMNEASTVIYHFGNVFIKQDDNEWKKISYKQGSELYSLILKYESDKEPD